MAVFYFMIFFCLLMAAQYNPKKTYISYKVLSLVLGLHVCLTMHSLRTVDT